MTGLSSSCRRLEILVWFGTHWQAHRVFKLGLVTRRAGPAVCYNARLLLWKLSGNCLSTWFGTQAHCVISESVPHNYLHQLRGLVMGRKSGGRPRAGRPSVLGCCCRWSAYTLKAEAGLRLGPAGRLCWVAAVTMIRKLLVNV